MRRRSGSQCRAAGCRRNRRITGAHEASSPPPVTRGMTPGRRRRAERSASQPQQVDVLQGAPFPPGRQTAGSIVVRDPSGQRARELWRNESPQATALPRTRRPTLGTGAAIGPEVTPAQGRKELRPTAAGSSMHHEPSQRRQGEQGVREACQHRPKIRDRRCGRVQQLAASRKYCLASVVLPTCRAPRIGATTGLQRSQQPFQRRFQGMQGSR